MPSFLSKVFGRKKDDKESPRRVTDNELLDGKFEAVSPSATNFPEAPNGRQGKQKEKFISVFCLKSRPGSPEIKQKRADVPQLSLNLPGPKDESASRALGVVFEADPDAQILLSDAAIGSRRLNPLETLILVRACSETIIARGLETLGIMHPHWYSASPEVQRKLISLFLQSLAPKSPITTLSPTPSAITNAFESEISSTRSPHDVAAVLRWGLRHLQLEGTSFGKEETWYKTFFDAERLAGYPPNGYSATLAPTLPTSHLELITAALELFSSLAAHAEANGISGSKLSKFFGLWLLTVQRSEDDDDWPTFYARWERTGRMLEHLFLSRIRDDATESRMPTRLLELVKRYPYRTDPHADLLARPRFSTIQYDALFVRIETELPTTADQPSRHPLRLISEAFKAEAAPDSGEHAALWEAIRKAGTNVDSTLTNAYPGLSHIFADETLRFFTLVPVDKESGETRSPSFDLYTRPSRRRSFSLGDKDAAAIAAAATSSVLLQPSKRASKPPTSPVTPSSVNSPIGVDWVTFSASGFLEEGTERAPLAATLLEKEKDMEVTIPRPSSPRHKTFTSGRKSLDMPRSLPKTEETKPSTASKAVTASPAKITSKSTRVALIQLDEAFVDFWNDALLDPISSTWPTFIVCRLKNVVPVTVEAGDKNIEWLVLEQAFKRPPPPTPVSPPEASTSSHESARRTRPSSPMSAKSDGSFGFGSAFKRFSFFTASSPGRSSTSSSPSKSKKKAGTSPRVGEMGEILAEEDEGVVKEKVKQNGKVKEAKDDTVRVRIPSPKPRKSVDAASAKKSLDSGSRTMNGTAAAGLVAGAATVVAGVEAAVVTTVTSAEPKAEAPADSTSVPPPTNEAAVTAPVFDEKAPEPALQHTEETINGSASVQDGHAPATVIADDESKPISETDLLKSDANPYAPPSADLICIYPGKPQGADLNGGAAHPELEAGPAVEEHQIEAEVTPPPVAEVDKEVVPSDEQTSAPLATVEDVHAEPASTQEAIVDHQELEPEAVVTAVAVEESSDATISTAVPVIEELPAVEETPVVEEAPVIEEASVVEETSTVDEAPLVEAPVEEARAIEEAPVVEEAPTVDAAAPIDEARPEGSESETTFQISPAEVLVPAIIATSAAIPEIQDEQHAEIQGSTQPLTGELPPATEVEAPIHANATDELEPEAEPELASEVHRVDAAPVAEPVEEVAVSEDVVGKLVPVADVPEGIKPTEPSVVDLEVTVEETPSTSLEDTPSQQIEVDTSPVADLEDIITGLGQKEVLHADVTDVSNTPVHEEALKELQAVVPEAEVVAEDILSPSTTAASRDDPVTKSVLQFSETVAPEPEVATEEAVEALEVIAEPAAKEVAEHVVEETAQPIIEEAGGPVDEHASKPTIDQIAAPVTEEIVEPDVNEAPVAEQIPEHAVEEEPVARTEVEEPDAAVLEANNPEVREQVVEPVVEKHAKHVQEAVDTAAKEEQVAEETVAESDYSHLEDTTPPVDKFVEEVKAELIPKQANIDEAETEQVPPTEEAIVEEAVFAAPKEDEATVPVEIAQTTTGAAVEEPAVDEEVVPVEQTPAVEEPVTSNVKDEVSPPAAEEIVAPAVEEVAPPSVEEPAPKTNVPSVADAAEAVIEEPIEVPATATSIVEDAVQEETSAPAENAMLKDVLEPVETDLAVEELSPGEVPAEKESSEVEATPVVKDETESSVPDVQASEVKEPAPITDATETVAEPAITSVAQEVAISAIDAMVEGHVFDVPPVANDTVQTAEETTAGEEEVAAMPLATQSELEVKDSRPTEVEPASEAAEVEGEVATEVETGAAQETTGENDAIVEHTLAVSGPVESVLVDQPTVEGVIEEDVQVTPAAEDKVETLVTAVETSELEEPADDSAVVTDTKESVNDAISTELVVEPQPEQAIEAAVAPATEEASVATEQPAEEEVVAPVVEEEPTPAAEFVPERVVEEAIAATPVVASTVIHEAVAPVEESNLAAPVVEEPSAPTEEVAAPIEKSTSSTEVPEPEAAPAVEKASAEDVIVAPSDDSVPADSVVEEAPTEEVVAHVVETELPAAEPEQGAEEAVVPVGESFPTAPLNEELSAPANEVVEEPISVAPLAENISAPAEDVIEQAPLSTTKPTHDASASVEGAAEEVAPVVEETVAPAEEVFTPIVEEEPTPSAEEPQPQEAAPAAEQVSAPVVQEEPTPSAAVPEPRDAARVIEGASAAAEEVAALTEDVIPIVDEEPTPSAEEPDPVEEPIEEGPPLAEENSTAVHEVVAPAEESVTVAAEEASAPAEVLVETETPEPEPQEATPAAPEVGEASAPAAEVVALEEESTPAVEETEPVAAAPIVEEKSTTSTVEEDVEEPIPAAPEVEDTLALPKEVVGENVSTPLAPELESEEAAQEPIASTPVVEETAVEEVIDPVEETASAPVVEDASTATEETTVPVVEEEKPVPLVQGPDHEPAEPASSAPTVEEAPATAEDVAPAEESVPAAPEVEEAPAPTEEAVAPVVEEEKITSSAEVPELKATTTIEEPIEEAAASVVDEAPTVADETTKLVTEKEEPTPLVAEAEHEEVVDMAVQEPVQESTSPNVEETAGVPTAEAVIEKDTPSSAAESAPERAGAASATVEEAVEEPSTATPAIEDTSAPKEVVPVAEEVTTPSAEQPEPQPEEAVSDNVPEESVTTASIVEERASTAEEEETQAPTPSAAEPEPEVEAPVHNEVVVAEAEAEATQDEAPADRDAVEPTQTSEPDPAPGSVDSVLAVEESALVELVAEEKTLEVEAAPVGEDDVETSNPAIEISEIKEPTNGSVAAAENGHSSAVDVAEEEPAKTAIQPESDDVNSTPQAQE